MTCDTRGGIQGSLGMGPNPSLAFHYYSSWKNSMLYYTKILFFPEWVHSFISLSLCFYCSFCLEWHFIPCLSRKLLCFKTHWWKRPRMNGASENKERGNFKKEAVWDTGVGYAISIPPSFHPAIMFGWDWPHLSSSRGAWLIWAYQVILFLCCRGGQSGHSISLDAVIGHMTWGGPIKVRPPPSPGQGWRKRVLLLSSPG